MAATRRNRSPARKTAAEPPPAPVSLVVDAALSKNARDVVVLDVRGATDVTDYFVICSADADVHARAIMEAVSEALEPIGRRPWHVEGKDTLSWVLVDFVDVVVHIFREDARRFYGLEEMWADAPRTAIAEASR